MEKLRLALVQMQSIIGDTKNNLEKMSRFVQKAGLANADFICFPELAITGYNREQAVDLAEEIPGPSSEFILNLAQKHKIIILTGIIEKSAENQKPYITHLICYPDGRYFKYRKTHLGASEKPFFSPGDELPVFEAGKANFAVQICWDCHFPEVSTIYSLKGAEVIFAPHASPTIVGDRREIWLRYLQARAYDNSVFFAVCNLIGENGTGSEFCGGLLVIGPKGQIIAEDFSNKEGLLIADLPSEQINKIRQEERKSMRNSFYLEYRRPELYGELIQDFK